MTYAQSEYTDQPWHLPSLISRRCPHEEPRTFSYPLSAVFAGRTGLFVVFVVQQLI